MAEIAYKKRIRVNISRGMKGAVSWEATVEMTDTDQEIVLAESDALIMELDHRYPVSVEK